MVRADFIVKVRARFLGSLKGSKRGLGSRSIQAKVRPRRGCGSQSKCEGEVTDIFGGGGPLCPKG